jgi:phosphatidate cytidylyltransferase
MKDPKRTRMAVADFMPEDASRYRDLIPRIATGVVGGVLLFFLALYPPPIWWGVTVAVISVFSASEFYALTRREHRRPNELFGLVAVGAMPLVASLTTGTAGFDGAVGLLLILTVLALLSLVWQVLFPSVTVTDSALTVFGAVYTGFMLSHMVLIRMMPTYGPQYVVTLLLSVWASDVAAYFAGTAFGRHRLAPHVSPRKSWEGAVAGAGACVAVWVIARFVIMGPVSLLWFAVIGVGVGIAAIVGDLVESRIKREAGAKDSGALLPGHGGFLDRFDSVIAAAVVAYYLLLWAGR